VTVTVTGANDAPTVADQNIVVFEDQPFQFTFLGNDVDNDPLTLSIISGPTHGLMTGEGMTRTFTSLADFNGIDIIEFTVNDGIEDSQVGKINVTVRPVNDRPNAYGQIVLVTGSQEKMLMFAGDDGDPDVEQSKQFIIFSLPSEGHLSKGSGGPPIVPGDLPLLLSGNQVYYTPVSNPSVTPLFQFQVRDDGGSANGGVDFSLPASITLLILP
jgi:hypothetical protein